MAEKFVHAADKADIKSGENKAVNVSGRDVALFNVDGKFYAIDNTCKHRGGPLGEGILDGTTVTCPWHGWQYDVTTGKSTSNSPEHVAKYHVKVEGEKILISLT